MAIVDHQERYKIAYFGIGLAGKQLSLSHIRAQLGDSYSSTIRIDFKETAKSLFLDCQNPALPQSFQLTTITGSSLYERTKIQSLDVASGIVFVADSQPSRMLENQHSLRMIVQFLRQQGRSILSIPFVFQYHKRDLPEDQIMSIDRMNYYLNPLHLPVFETDIKQRSGGIMDAFDTITRMVAAQQEKTFVADR